MSRATFVVDLGFDKFRFSADLSQASAPIYIVGDEDQGIDDQCTPYQTADARHREYDAAALALRYCGREYYAQPDDDRDEDEIIEELLDGAEIEREEAPREVYVVRWSDGRRDECDTYGEATALVRSECPDAEIGHDGDLRDGGDRTLCWETLEDSVNDPGARAICSIWVES